MTEDQVRAVCALLDERNQVRNRVTGEFKGVVDRQQESIAKEAPVIPSDSKPQPMPAQGSLGLDDVPSGDSRSKYLEKEMPEEAAELKRAPHVRLVRGFAGTGKTDVLILRAHYLHEQFPELDILVTTFNHPLWQQRLRPELDGVADVVKFDTLCASIYRKKHGCWRSPVATNGVVAAMAAHNPQVDEFGRDFLTEEFIWMKETERTSRTQYVTGVREGRGTLSRRALSRKMKEQVFDLFEVYEERLGAMPAYDWVDLHDRVRAYLEEGIAPDKRYDVVLVDEAQHFAPTWMSILDHFVKPGGSLFLCDDPSQSVYRYFSWRQKGVEVVGRTRWLQVPYRNTREIFQAAYALIAENPLAQQLLAESAEAVTPELAHAKMRSGQQPQVHEFATWRDEQAFVVAEVNKLVQGGVYPSEIAVLHDEKHVRNKYQSLLPSGVNIYEVRKQTGLEYKVVFVPQVQQMVTRAVGRSLAEEEARNKLKFYMTMTRARDRLYILYTRKWPSCLDGLRSYAEWIHHT
jgi:superfamily I DNA/RNA helicase